MEQIRRKEIRLAEYDYSSSGAYFVTVCSDFRRHVFGRIKGMEMKLNRFGIAVQSVWDHLERHFPEIALDQFVIMPNHIHAIIWILDRSVLAGLRPAPDPIGRKAAFKAASTTEPKIHCLSDIVRSLKGFSTREINALRGTSGKTVWQQNYYERIIRTDEELFKTRNYILENPQRWDSDPDRPVRIDWSYWQI